MNKTFEENEMYTKKAKAAHEKISSNESRRFYKFLKTVFDICELSGFKLEGHITVRDVKTGKLWK